MNVIKDKRLIEEFTSIVTETINDSNYSLDYVCKSLYLSRSQLHRRIKSITGLSTTYYIRKIRLEKSKQMLRNTTFLISEISIAVGINSSQNFSKYFKKEYGITPSNFKKSISTKGR